MNYYITYPNELTGARDIVSPPLSRAMAKTLISSPSSWPHPEFLGLVSEDDTNQLLFNL